MSFPFRIPLSDEQTREQSSTQAHPLGAAGETSDGRSFRYVKNGATAGARGLLAAAANPGPWSTNTYIPVTVAATAGATQVYIADTATGSVTANYYKDGWLLVNSTSTGDSCVQMLRIKSHAAFTSSTGGTTGVAVNLHPTTPVLFAITTDAATMYINLQASPYMAVIPFPVPTGYTSNLAVGVYVSNMTAAYYGWIQTWGPAIVRIGDTVWDLVRGMGVYPCTAASTGAIGAGASTGLIWTDTSTDQLRVNHFITKVGYSLNALTAANQMAAIYLTIAP